MSTKRSRAAYEADLQAQQSPFVLFGTPLPPLDPDVRDDGSYVPVWKQEVRDERGRKRLHGAFTGGWSAGYFNTVGSKEGWTPSSFVSSRTNRRKDDPGAAQHRPEDYMDEEDLADAEEARKIQTSQGFAGLGLTQDDTARAAGLAGLFKVEGDTMGTKLLKKMGWKEGQGIGPKVRRSARLDVGRTGDGKTTYLFAPDNVAMVSFLKKTDRKGLGFEGESRLAPIESLSREDRAGLSDNEDDNLSRPTRPFGAASTGKKEKKSRGGIGMGVLNDTGSDDEDPYEIGPRISYNRVIGGDKKKKKKERVSNGGGGGTYANPSLASKPVFVPKKSGLGKLALRGRKCHDGRFSLAGFVFGQKPDSLLSEINSEGKFPPPTIPEGWRPAKEVEAAKKSSAYVSTADAAKASALDPKSRAALLGEKQLPGKSVFDFMSPAARERLVAATGRSDLPEARGEVPTGYALSEQEKSQQLLSEVPKLEKETAIAAISRGAQGGGPYGEDEAKRSRYRAYLEHQAGMRSALPPKLPTMSNDDWLRELHEFYNVARIFKPMSGFMASRFTTSSTTGKLSSGSSGQADDGELVKRPPPKPQDPAEEAAKMGMYGAMTRSVQDFFPTRLLCKRLGVKPPANVQPDAQFEAARPSKAGSSHPYSSYPEYSSPSYRGATTSTGADDDISASGSENAAKAVDRPELAGASPLTGTRSAAEPAENVVDASRNEALEGQRAGEDVFRAIFGDSSDEEE